MFLKIFYWIASEIRKRRNKKKNFNLIVLIISPEWIHGLLDGLSLGYRTQRILRKVRNRLVKASVGKKKIVVLLLACTAVDFKGTR